MTPKQQRDAVEKILEESQKIVKDDFLILRKEYIELNQGLAVAYDYDKDKSQKYVNNANRMIEQSKKQDSMGKWERDEDTNEKILIPHKDDEKLYDKFKKDNRDLYKKLDNEFSSMKTELSFFRDTKEKLDEFKRNPSERSGSNLLKNFIELEESKAFTKTDKQGQIKLETGKEINKERFYKNYPEATEKLEKNIKIHLKNQENNKYNEKGREI